MRSHTVPPPPLTPQSGDRAALARATRGTDAAGREGRGAHRRRHPPAPGVPGHLYVWDGVNCRDASCVCGRVLCLCSAGTRTVTPTHKHHTHQHRPEGVPPDQPTPAQDPTQGDGRLPPLRRLHGAGRTRLRRGGRRRLQRAAAAGMYQQGRGAAGGRGHVCAP